jgi:chromosome segregation ATPase
MSEIVNDFLTNLKTEMEKMKEEMERMKQEMENMKRENSEMKKKLEEKNYKKLTDKSTIEENNNLSIILTQYKKSILLKNMYSDKNTTVKCKEILKEMGAKWLKTADTQGWLFVGEFKEGKSMKENSQFIIEKLESMNFNLEIGY